MQGRLAANEADAIIRSVFAGGTELPTREADGRVIWPAGWETRDRACWAALDEAFSPWPAARIDFPAPLLPDAERTAPKHRRRIKLMNPAILAILTGGFAALLLLQSTAG